MFRYLYPIVSLISAASYG